VEGLRGKGLEFETVDRMIDSSANSH